MLAWLTPDSFDSAVGVNSRRGSVCPDKFRGESRASARSARVRSGTCQGRTGRQRNNEPGPCTEAIVPWATGERRFAVLARTIAGQVS
jgi:hypothetical protein